MNTNLSNSISNNQNNTISNEQDQSLVKAFYQLETSRKINVLASSTIIILGLIGNITISALFSNKKTRFNSARVYFFYLSLIDGLFLLVHLFEDTIRNYNDIYNNSDELQTAAEKQAKNLMNSIAYLINITDKYDLTCRLINYFRYVFRFTSVYIIVAFTIQRLLMLHSPLNYSNFQSYDTAWITIWIITSLSAIMNTWVLFLFEIQQDETKHADMRTFCDIKVSWKAEYFQISSFFIFLVILVPIIILLISDVAIIVYLIKKKNKQYSMRIRRFSKFKTDNNNSNNNNNMIPLMSPNQNKYKRKQLDLRNKIVGSKMDLNIEPVAPGNTFDKRSSTSILPLRRFSLILNSNFNKVTNSSEDVDNRRITIITVLLSL